MLVPVADALAAIHAQLGRPTLVPMDVAAGPAALRREVDRPDVLVAVLARHASEAHLVRTWLRGQDARGVRVAEGYLVLVHTPGPARSPEPARPAPWTTPDARPVPGATEADLDEAVLRQLLCAIDRSEERPSTEAGSTTERALGRAGILAHDGGVWRPTVAALVLFGRRPDLFLPGCRLDATVDGERFMLRGTLLEVGRALDRSPAGTLDPFVVHEALNNAFLHRDWSEEGARSPIVLTVEGSRVDMSDPGRVLLGAPRTRQWPNPLLADFARRLRLVRGAGTGLARVGRRLEAAGVPRWSLVDRDGWVHFVCDLPEPRSRTTRDLPRHPQAATPARLIVPLRPPSPPAPPAASRPPPPPKAVTTPEPPPIPMLLPREPDDRADAVLGVLRAGATTARQIAEALGCSRPVVGKVLTVLVAEGRVRPTSASSRSPFQAYEVA